MLNQPVGGLLGARFFMQWLLTFVLLVPTTSRAQASTSVADRATKTFGNSAQDVEMRYLDGRIQAVRKNSAGQEFVFEMPESSDAELRKFSPETMMARFKNAMKGTHPLSTFKETYQRFPRESFLFFLAIGGVTLFQMATDSASNPMRMQQHLEHSISPLGMFSFFTFMYANGATTNFLAGALKNPRFHSFIPYMGMTAGFFVQSTISAFAADPEVKSCVSQLLGHSPGKDEKACDGAYARYVLRKQLSLAAPGLISMMASTVMAGLIQKGVTYGVFKLTGVDIAMWFVPGGVGVQLVRFAIMSTIQMALFYYIDAGWLNRKVTFAWRNVIDGWSLKRLENELVGRIATKKTSKWADQLTPLLCKMSGQTSGCERDLAATLKAFQAEAADWRMLNLLDVYEPHQAWQEKLSQISGQYNLSRSFYRDLVEETRNSRFELVPPLLRRLDVAAPLSGVMAKDVTAEKVSVLYQKPAFYEEAARLHAVDVGTWLNEQLDKNAFAQEAMTPWDTQYLRELAKVLVAGVAVDQGRAIADLNSKIADDRRGTMLSTRTKVFEAVRRNLGDPTPYFEKGRGFLAAFEFFSESAPLVKNTAFPKIGGQFQTPRATDAMALQTVCGPDVNAGSLIVSSEGFHASFQAPRLVEFSPAVDFLCRGGAGERTVNNLYRNSFTNAQGVSSNGVLEYLKANLNPEILGSKEKSGFDAWWDQKVEGSIRAAYEDYGSKYSEIIANLVRTLASNADSGWNAGPLANGTITSVRQQMRLDLMILGELLKDLHQAQKKADLPAALYSPVREPVPGPREQDGNDSSAGLLAALRRGGSTPDSTNRFQIPGTVFEWNSLIRTWNNPAATTAGPVTGRALQAQKEIEAEFETLIAMLRRIQVKKIDQEQIVRVGRSTTRKMVGVDRIVSDLENDDLQKQVERIGQSLTKFSDLLGTGDKKESAIVQLSGEQRDVAVTALEGLQGLAGELGLYGLMANALSWDKINGLKKAKAEAAAVDSKLNNALDELGAMLRQREQALDGDDQVQKEEKL